MNFRPEWDEGEKVTDQLAAYRAPTKWTGPDYPEKIKQKYFGARAMPDPKNPESAFPSWIYHKDLPARVVRTAKEAREYGVVFRAATEEERVRYHAPSAFYACDGEWRTEPYGKDLKRDPENLQPGKILVHQLIDHAKKQADLMEVLVRGQSNSTPNVEIEVLRQQLAKQQEMLDRLLYGDTPKPRDIQSKVDPEVTAEAHQNALSEFVLNDPELKDVLRDQAAALGIKVDKRWSARRLEEEIKTATEGTSA